MCEDCQKLALKHFGYLPREEIPELLMGATCFPFCHGLTLEKQMIEIKMKTDGTLHGALAFADREMDREWERYKAAKLDNPSEEGLEDKDE